jgi:hypothetical protein
LRHIGIIGQEMALGKRTCGPEAVIMTWMEIINPMSGWKWWLTVVVLLAGCQPAPPPPAPPQASVTSDPMPLPDPTTNWALVMRAADDMGLARKDPPLPVSSPQRIARLKTFFPDMQTTATSTMHAGWTPLIVIRFHTANGKDTYVVSDYRIYRVDQGDRGDFVVLPGFADYVDQLLATAAAR